MSWKRCTPAPAGTSSSWSGAATGTRSCGATPPALARAFANTVDGQFQTFAANDGAFNRAHFFNQNPELAALVADWTDDAIDRLHRGGHDMVKIHAATIARRATGASPPSSWRRPRRASAWARPARAR